MNYELVVFDACVWYLRVQDVVGIAGWACIIAGVIGWVVVRKVWPFFRELFSDKKGLSNSKGEAS